jgi:hypothetical protein
MKDIVETGLLFDFYGSMLTKRQRDVLVFYLNENYSLAEISEKLGISRQGVHDIIKRASAKLEKYEEKLHLRDRMLENDRLAQNALKAVRDGDGKLAEKLIKKIAEG